MWITTGKEANMAGVKLHLSTSEVWNHFFQNVDRLQDFEDCIAENEDNGMSLYITAVALYPQLVLYANQTPVLYRIVRSQEEASKWSVWLITKFVAGIDIESPEEKEDKPKIIDLPMSREETRPVVAPSEKYEEEIEEEENEIDQKTLDLIYEREDQLNQAMGDFLATILFEEDGVAVKEIYGKELVSEAVDDFLQYLADQHNVSVYRPTLDTDPETGEEILKEFPYGWDENYEDIE